jgi:hypothetical protein
VGASNSIIKLAPNGKEAPVVVANITGAASVQFGKSEKDKKVMYVSAGSQGTLVSVTLP